MSKQMLVKWEAALLPDPDSPPNVTDPEMDPATHPACIEVIELNDGQRPQTIYRRLEDASHD